MAKSVDKQLYSAKDRLQVSIEGKLIDLFSVQSFIVTRMAKTARTISDLTSSEEYAHGKTNETIPISVTLTHACTEKYEDKLKEINEAVSGYNMVLYSTSNKKEKEVHLKNCRMINSFSIISSSVGNNAIPEDVASPVTFEGTER